MAPVVVLAFAAVLSTVGILEGVQWHDEGLVLQAADRVAAGQWPYSDFFWAHGPGQPLVLAALFKTFGVSLLSWRIELVVVDAVIAVSAYLLVRREASLPLALAIGLVVGLLVTCGPRLPNPTAPAVMFGLAGAVLARRRPVVGGVLAGVATVFRPDFGLGAVLGTVLAAERKGAPRAVASALLTSVGLWAPFVIVAGPGTIWRQTFGFATGAANDLPFPFPIRYTGTFDALGVLRFYQPVLMLAGLGLGLLMAVSQRRRLSAMAPVGLAVVGVPYLIAGPLSPRYVPLSVCVVLLLATVGLAPPRRFAPSTVAAVAVIGLITVASIDLWRIKQQTPPFAPLSGAIADGVETTPAEVRDVERVVRYVDARVARGRPVFVANPTHDDVLVGNALLNVLLQRPNPTHYVFLQQGLTTTAPVQREIIADLERTKPTIVVRWLSPFAYIRASKKPGARLLDLYLRAHYHGVARFGEFEAQRRGLDPAVSGLLGRPDTGASP